MKAVHSFLIACGSGIALLLILAAIFGHDPVELARIALSGSIGSRFAIEGTLLKSVPLLLTGLAVAIAFRAGAWNIGAEGQFIAGALAALVVSPAGALASLIAAAVAGALWASVASLLRVWRDAPEVLTTILLNFVAIHLLGWCVNGPLRERVGQYPQSDPAAASLSTFGSSRVHAGIAIALLLAAVVWFLLHRTTEGLRLRASGFNPLAAEWAGIRTKAQIVRAMAVSGALAGVAGGTELLGVTHRLFERFAAGYGYSGIAVALLANLDPLGAVAAALFFGALGTGAGELQRTANVSASIAIVAQAVIVLTLVAAGRFRSDD